MKHYFSRKVLTFRISLLLIALAFAILTFLVKQKPYFNIDLQITRAIQFINNFWFDLSMKFLSFIGDPIPGTLITTVIVLFFLYKRKYKEGLILMVSIAGGYLISEIFKNLISRTRPDPSLINQITHYIRNDSFPSGHVLFYISFYGFLFFLVYANLSKNFLKQILLIFLFLMIILIGPSRIYVGAHWFSDVLGAYLIGFLWLSFVILLYNHLHNKKAKNEK